MNELGGIPSMLSDFDSTSPPEEKSMVGCVAYLCSRLIESSAEIQATLAIQRAFRRYYGFFLLEKKIAASSTIWSWWNSVKANLAHAEVMTQRLRRKKSSEQKLFTSAASTLARFYRCAVARRTLRTLLSLQRTLHDSAATAIQSVMRMNLACTSAIMRSYAIVLIQSQFRRAIALMRIARLNAAATIIQSVFRRNTAQINTIILVLSAVSIQRVARGMLGRKAALDRLAEVENAFEEAMHQQALEVAAVTKLQALVRGYVLRTDMFFNHFAATEVQRTYRGFSAFRRYQSVLVGVVALQARARKRIHIADYALARHAACIIQNFYRTATLLKGEQQSQAVTLIQKCARGRIRRQTAGGDFTRFRVSCVTIQSVFRGFAAKTDFNATKASVILAQALVRSKIATLSLQRSLRAVTLVQALARARAARTDFALARSAASIIQRQFRASVFERAAKANFDATRSSVVLVQALVRSKIASCALQRCLRAVILIQALARGHIARMDLALSHFAASIIQSQCRAFAVKLRAMERFEAERAAITLVQSTVRSKIASRSLRKSIAATSMIQALARGHITRMDLALSHFAATEIQRTVRGSSQQVKYILAILATIKIQAIVRMEQARADFGVKKLAAVIVQHFWRSAKLAKGEKQEAAAVLLQSFARAKTARSAFVAQKKGVTAIQALARGHLERCAFKKVVDAVILVQSVFRSKIASRSLRKSIAATSLIQAAFRGFSSRLDLQLSHFAATEIQRTFRGSSQQVKYILVVLATINIQSFMRMNIARDNLALAKLAASMLQHFWRSVLVSKSAKSDAAATLIQACARRIKSKKGFEVTRLSCVRIQAVVRGRIARKQLSVALRKITQIQALARMRQAKDVLRRSVAGVTALQSLWRGFSARGNLEFLNFASQIIQKWARSFTAQRKFATLRGGVVAVQALVRMNVVQTYMQLCAFAATMIQTHARMVAAKKGAEMRRDQIKESHVERLTRQNNAKVLQRCAREFLRRTEMKRVGGRIVRAGRGFLGRLRAKRVAQGIARLQAVKRGQKTRKRTDKKMSFIRKRLALANKTALERPEMALGKRCLIALDTILNSKRLAVVMQVMSTLEVSTQHSERCCEMFAAAEAPKILFELIRSCNRSLPHIELLNYVLRTICNVAKYEYLVESVACDIAVDTLMDLLQTFRVNDDIMAKCCDILVLVCAADAKSRAKMQSAANCKRVNGLLNMTKRSAGIDTRVGGVRGGKKKQVPAGLKALQRLFVAVLDEVAGDHKENM